MIDSSRYPHIAKRIKDPNNLIPAEKVERSNYPNIAKVVRQYRVQADIGQDAVGKALGYKNQQLISNVERGQCSLPLKAAPKLASLLSIPREKIYHAFIMDNIIKYERAFNGK